MKITNFEKVGFNWSVIINKKVFLTEFVTLEMLDFLTFSTQIDTLTSIEYSE